jgi:tetratricopeptide (TPR) repeat protein
MRQLQLSRRWSIPALIVVVLGLPNGFLRAQTAQTAQATPPPSRRAQPGPPGASAEAWAAEGKKYYDAEDYARAVEAYKRALALRPNPPLAGTLYNNLGNAYLHLRRFDDAIVAFREAVRLRPTNHDTRFRLGRAYYHAAQFQEALPTLQEAVRLNPKSGDYHYWIGATYLHGLKDPEKALAAYRECLRLTPDDVRAIHETGSAHLKLRRYPDAVTAFQQAIRLKPDNPDYHGSLGLAYSKSVQFPKAAAAYQEAVRLKPDDEYALRELGTAYAMMGRKTEAMQVYNRLLKLDKGTAELLLGDINRPGGPAAILATHAQTERLVCAMTDDCDEEGAMEDLRNAQRLHQRLNPADPEVLFEIGEAYWFWERSDDALAVYRSILAMKAKPEALARAHREIGFMYNEKKEYAKAVPELQEAQRIKPDDYTSGLLGEAYIGLQDYPNAVPALQDAVRLKPDYAKWHMNLGKAYLAMKQPDKALAEFQEVVRLEPKNAEGFYELGHIYFLLRRPPEAVAAFNQAISLAPKHAMAHFGLGHAYRVMGRRREAMREYETLKSLDPKLAQDLLNALNRPN